MIPIRYISGDATSPISNGNKIIMHCVNDIGAWGAGFVLAISKKWKQVKTEYLKWTTQENFKLGNVLFVPVEKDIIIANIIGQHGIKNINNISPIRYEALDVGFLKVANKAADTSSTIHCPLIGAGLAGGNWKIIEDLIIKNISNRDIQVIVYLI